MLIQSDCIPCILNMTLGSLRRLDISEPAMKTLLQDILVIPGLNGGNWQRTSPDIIEDIMEKIYDFVGNTDPFCELKKQINTQVRQMEPYAQDLIHRAADPVHMASKLAIIGNTIDFMMPGSTDAVRETIQERLSLSLPEKSYSQFYDQLSRTKKLVYITDNCGEIVFDKLLINTLKQIFNCHVTVVVRKNPTLNDATKKEALEIGMNDVANVIDNGIDGPLPGTILARCSNRVQALIDHADLIISKGGGNFDSLEEQIPTLKTKLTFMLLSKCHPINTYFNTQLHQGIIANYFN